jgi:hypothetical protein
MLLCTVHDVSPGDEPQVTGYATSAGVEVVGIEIVGRMAGQVLAIGITEPSGQVFVVAGQVLAIGITEPSGQVFVVAGQVLAIGITEPSGQVFVVGGQSIEPMSGKPQKKPGGEEEVTVTPAV